MPRNNHAGNFKKGNKGKPKGVVTHNTQKAKELILAAIDNNSQLFNETMMDLQAKEPREWAKIMVKLMDFVLPKKLDIDHTTQGDKITQWKLEPIKELPSQ